jgi:formate/nitrite transporter FocA (FNT family)
MIRSQDEHDTQSDRTSHPPQDQQDQQQDHREEQEVHERSSPSGKIVYRAILKEGREELDRSSAALFWSGLAAGLSMGFSMMVEGVLRARLPHAEWRPLVAKLGYSVGFLIVILGRQQLFTENTLTPILPLLQEKKPHVLGNVLRLWTVVLIANLFGALLFALAAMHTSTFSADIKQSFIELGHDQMIWSFGTVLLKGIFAGWLIALMVWLLPFAEAARFFVIIAITYVVAIGQFTHIIAGAVEVFALAFSGEKPWFDVLIKYIVPTLIGNIIGGVTLVAALNHAQVVAGEEGEDL